MKLPHWQRPELLLLGMAAASSLGFSAWLALIDNFSIHRAAFTGREIGILQSLREVPGFIAFTVIWVLLLIREQKFALVSLMLLGIGIAITGLFPSVLGLYCTTVLMSIGFHYYHTLQASLALQWTEKAHTPEMLGRLIAVGSFASIVAFGLIWVSFEIVGLDYHWVYLIAGGATVVIALFGWFVYPQFTPPVKQHQRIILRRRYWLYYALVFMSGARRQIFVVFAGFLLVEKFDFDVGMITMLFLINATINVFFARHIGRAIGRIGERLALLIEYTGLIGVFVGYAFVSSGTVAAVLYVIDHLFFAIAIAIDTYFQKIADPADIAATAGISFTINHIAAVVLPVVLGILWIFSPAAVFLSGAAMAVVSLALAWLVPRYPQPGHEADFPIGRKPTAAIETI